MFLRQLNEKTIKTIAHPCSERTATGWASCIKDTKFLMAFNG
jgi:hypothetical protein